jgi:hypothetical protein
MKVVCSENGKLAIVDRSEHTASMNIKKNTRGQRRYTPRSWPTTIDDTDTIHLNRPGAEVQRDWTTCA